TEISIGAIGGALLAGPVGFVIGGIAGGIVGGQEADEEVQAIDALAENESMLEEVIESVSDNDESENVQLASIDNSMPLLVSEPTVEINSLQEIISNDLSLDVYFKAGSVDIEKFYSQQLSVISSLFSEIPGLQLNLDGYSDRQGNEAENFQLSIARLQSVRNYFVDHGIDESRINVNAYGEKNFVSSPGELASYVFDRRVVVSFTTTSSSSSNDVAVITETPSM
ncbi:MAG: OmpA family protein, partial [Gammaproteobacteria bacterium]|nr:OmpA family protein [Gammaproteobacteria bacterium]